MTDGDVADWLREQCIILAQNNSTPIPFWLDLSLPDLQEWIGANNRVQKMLQQK